MAVLGHHIVDICNKWKFIRIYKALKMNKFGGICAKEIQNARACGAARRHLLNFAGTF